MIDLLSLAIPFAYLAVLIGSLATFSSLYRKRKAGKLAVCTMRRNLALVANDLMQ